MSDTKLELRDRIAIAALNGMLAHSTRYSPRQGANPDWHFAIAEEAYELADAMLNARNNKPYFVENVGLISIKMEANNGTGS